MHITPALIVDRHHGFARLNATIVFTWAVMLVRVTGSALVTRRLSHGLCAVRPTASSSAPAFA